MLTLMMLTLLIRSNSLCQEQEWIANKCCPLGQHLDTNFADCVPTGTKFHEVPDKEEWNIESNWTTRIFSLHRPSNEEQVVQWPSCKENLTTLVMKSNSDLQRIDWFPNGTLSLLSPTSKGGQKDTVIPTEDFCVDTYIQSDGFLRPAFLICPCKTVRCINKCCPIGEIIVCNSSDCFCDKMDENIPEHAANDINSHFFGIPRFEDDFSYEILIMNTPMCPVHERLVFDNPLYRPSHIMMSWWNYPNGYLFDRSNCVNLVNFKNQRLFYSVGYCEKREPFENFVDFLSLLHLPSIILLLISLIFLHLSPPESVTSQGFVHNGALKSHIIALLFPNVILGIFSLFQDYTNYCKVAPILMNFWLLAASFWLSCIWMNMAIGFRTTRRTNREPVLQIGMRRLAWFSLYAWGTPLLLTSFTAAMWYAPSVPSGLKRPTLMESRRCLWEDEAGRFDKTATLFYYYGPICGLLVLNLSLFLFITRQVCRLRRDSSFLQQSGNCSSQQDTQNSALLYAKLLWLVGAVDVLLEIIAWATHHGGPWYHLTADLIDLLRATAIFVLTVCRRKQIQQVRTRLEGSSLVKWINSRFPFRRRIQAGRSRQTQPCFSVCNDCTREGPVP